MKTITLNSGQPYTDRFFSCELSEQMIRCNAPFSFEVTRGGFYRFSFPHEADFKTALAYMTSRAHKDTFQTGEMAA